MSTLTKYKCKGVFDRQALATWILGIVAATIVIIAVVMAFWGCAK